MCARLIRLFNENYGKKRAIHSATPKGKHDFFPDDEDFAEEFLEQRWIIDISTDDSVLNSHENNAMANPHTPWAPELIKALVHAEQFMR